jgi:hypothetical protein
MSREYEVMLQGRKVNRAKKAKQTESVVYSLERNEPTGIYYYAYRGKRYAYAKDPRRARAPKSSKQLQDLIAKGKIVPVTLEHQVGAKRSTKAYIPKDPTVATRPPSVVNPFIIPAGASIPASLAHTIPFTDVPMDYGVHAERKKDRKPRAEIRDAPKGRKTKAVVIDPIMAAALLAPLPMPAPPEKKKRAPRKMGVKKEVPVDIPLTAAPIPKKPRGRPRKVQTVVLPPLPPITISRDMAHAIRLPDAPVPYKRQSRAGKQYVPELTKDGSYFYRFKGKRYSHSSFSGGSRPPILNIKEIKILVDQNKLVPYAGLRKVYGAGK